MKVGRGDRIRTCDLYVPNVALYQTELHPDGVEPRIVGGEVGPGNTLREKTVAGRPGNG